MAEEIEPRPARVVVFVCTGNTCRSPMAEAICKRLLADRLGCAADELAGRGWVITSAGLAATEGMPAAREAVEAVRAHGGDLGDHRSKPLCEDLVLQADVLLGMTRGHVEPLREALESHPVEVRPLSPDGDDIDDPIGQPAAAYEACARRMRACIEALLAEWGVP
jgi:L-threonylcarbamoyladenylate synthase